MTTSNKCKILLIDCGNSYQKIAVYQNNKMLEFVQLPSKNNILEGLGQLKHCDGVSKIFILTNGKIDNHLIMLKAKFSKAETKIIIAQDFDGILDLSNVDKDVTIGNDILLLNYWASKQNNIKAVVCLGTVYFALIVNKTKFNSVVLLPSFVKGLEQIEHNSSIPSQLIPAEFNKTSGLNTPDSFAAGLNIAMDGFVKEIINTYKISKDQLVITGGDAPKFKSLKKYKNIDHLTIKALALFVKEKHW